MEKKILIVDDDARMVESMKLILEEEGYQVTKALSGEEGLRKAKQERPNLIVLDVMMPDMDGFEVSREIRKDPKVQEIPILMLTAIKEAMGLDFKKEAGDKDWLPVDDYCDKPVTPDVLISKVDKLLHTEKSRFV